MPSRSSKSSRKATEDDVDTPQSTPKPRSNARSMSRRRGSPSLSSPPSTRATGHQSAAKTKPDKPSANVPSSSQQAEATPSTATPRRNPMNFDAILAHIAEMDEAAEQKTPIKRKTMTEKEKAIEKEKIKLQKKEAKNKAMDLRREQIRRTFQKDKFFQKYTPSRIGSPESSTPRRQQVVPSGSPAVAGQPKGAGPSDFATPRGARSTAPRGVASVPRVQQAGRTPRGQSVGGAPSARMTEKERQKYVLAKMAAMNPEEFNERYAENWFPELKGVSGEANKTPARAGVGHYVQTTTNAWHHLPEKFRAPKVVPYKGFHPADIQASSTIINYGHFDEGRDTLVNLLDYKEDDIRRRQALAMRVELPSAIMRDDSMPGPSEAGPSEAGPSQRGGPQPMASQPGGQGSAQPAPSFPGDDKDSSSDDEDDKGDKDDVDEDAVQEHLDVQKQLFPTSSKKEQVVRAKEIRQKLIKQAEQPASGRPTRTRWLESAESSVMSTPVREEAPRGRSNVPTVRRIDWDSSPESRSSSRQTRSTRASSNAGSTVSSRPARQASSTPQATASAPSATPQTAVRRSTRATQKTKPFVVTPSRRTVASDKNAELADTPAAANANAMRTMGALFNANQSSTAPKSTTKRPNQQDEDNSTDDDEEESSNSEDDTDFEFDSTDEDELTQMDREQMDVDEDEDDSEEESREAKKARLEQEKAAKRELKLKKAAEKRKSLEAQQYIRTLAKRRRLQEKEDLEKFKAIRREERRLRKEEQERVKRQKKADKELAKVLKQQELEARGQMEAINKRKIFLDKTPKTKVVPDAKNQAWYNSIQRRATRRRVKNIQEILEAEAQKRKRSGRRAYSMPPAFNRAQSLVEKTRIVSKEAESLFHKEINEGREMMKKEKERVVAFLEGVEKLNAEHFFVSIQDPYYKAYKSWEHFARPYATNPSSIKIDPIKLTYPMIVTDEERRATNEVWKDSVQARLPLAFRKPRTTNTVRPLANKLGILCIGELPLIGDTMLHNPKKRLEEMKHFIEKFQYAFHEWKLHYNWANMPRVIVLFNHMVAECYYDVEYVHGVKPHPDLPKDEYNKARFMRDLLFWLPVHLGDLRTKNHNPLKSQADLARVLMGFLLDEWEGACSEFLVEDKHLLVRLQLALLRLECSDQDSNENRVLIDPYPHWKPVLERRGMIERGREALQEKAEEEGRWKDLARLKPLVDKRRVLHRSQSFSEFTTVSFNMRKSCYAPVEWHEIRNIDEDL